MLRNRQIYLNTTTTSGYKNMVGKRILHHHETFKVSLWFAVPYQYNSHAIVTYIKKEK